MRTSWNSSGMTSSCPSWRGKHRGHNSRSKRVRHLASEGWWSCGVYWACQNGSSRRNSSNQCRYFASQLQPFMRTFHTLWSCVLWLVALIHICIPETWLSKIKPWCWKEKARFPLIHGRLWTNWAALRVEWLVNPALLLRQQTMWVLPTLSHEWYFTIGNWIYVMKG